MEYDKALRSEGRATAIAQEIKSTELETLRTALSDRLDQLDNALDRLTRTRTRLFGAHPEEVKPGSNPETPPNGVLDGLRRELIRLEHSRDWARELADSFDKLA